MRHAGLPPPQDFKKTKSGISKGNILELAGSGVDGVALVSAVFSAEDIESECRELSALSEKMISA